jgi:hypothetical protein
VGRRFGSEEGVTGGLGGVNARWDKDWEEGVGVGLAVPENAGEKAGWEEGLGRGLGGVTARWDKDWEGAWRGFGWVKGRQERDWNGVPGMCSELE